MLKNNAQSKESRLLSPAPAKTEQAWATLATEQQVNCKLLRPEIAISWHRCLSLGVDPYESRTFRVPDSEDKIKDQRLLLTAATHHMRRLYETLNGTGYIVSLIDRSGLILELFGDKCMYSTAESLDIVTGNSNSEIAIGTTAPGICLAQGVAVQVLLNEHYCRLYHNWCCSAAPIYDGNRRLLGVLNISSLDLSKHQSHILYMVQMAANAIGADINNRLLHDEYKKTFIYFESVMNGSPDALLLFDDKDTVIHMNNNARQLLGADSACYIGRKAHSIISNFSAAKYALQNGKEWAQLHFGADKQDPAIDAHLQQLHTEYRQPLGILSRLQKKRQAKNDAPEARYEFHDFVYHGKSIASLLENAKKAALTEQTILIQGESGTGKEILCQAIHNNSLRRGKPFITVNCAALPNDLAQSELAGYAGETFTGDDKFGKPGKFELANGGTLFLDEISDMPLASQGHLLRVLQEKNAVRSDEGRSTSLDIRIIAATSKDLAQEVAEGRFRADLYYRLAVINLSIPPLREHKEDLWVLIEHLVRKNQTRPVRFKNWHFPTAVKNLLQDYNWPGNVRELENTVIFFLSKMRGQIVTVADLPQHLSPCSTGQAKIDELSEVEEQAIKTALQQSGNHISNTAKQLGISRATLYRKIKKYNLV